MKTNRKIFVVAVMLIIATFAQSKDSYYYPDYGEVTCEIDPNAQYHQIKSAVESQIYRPKLHYVCSTCGHEEYICPYCHNEITATEHKCPHCGKKISL